MKIAPMLLNDCAGAVVRDEMLLPGRKRAGATILPVMRIFGTTLIARSVTGNQGICLTLQFDVTYF